MQFSCETNLDIDAHEGLLIFPCKWILTKLDNITSNFWWERNRFSETSISHAL